jgi:DNA-binding transcriptional LysR family regulator
LELREVATFLVLAEELHFGKTAARLHLTQGRVSQTIRALEREVGGSLFERTSRTVRLTSLGAQFREGAQRGYDQLHQTLRECQQVARAVHAELSVGYLPSIGPYVTQLVREYEQTYPGREVRLSAMSNFGMPYGFEFREDSNMALIWSPGGDGSALAAPGRTVGPVLQRIPRGVLVPAGHPLTSHQSISIEDLVGYDLLNPCKIWRPELLDAWTPKVTPSGHALNRLDEDVPAMAGSSELSIEDFLTLVIRRRGLHVTVATVLDRLSLPDLAVVPIHDMPPMVVVPIWPTAARTSVIDDFVALAVSFSAT